MRSSARSGGGIAAFLMAALLCHQGCAPASEWYTGNTPDAQTDEAKPSTVAEPPPAVAPSSAKEDVDPLKQRVLLLPFRDMTDHKGPWAIQTEFARGLGDSLRKFDFLHIIPVDAVVQHLTDDELKGLFGKARAIQLARLTGADISVMAEIEVLTMKRQRVTVPLGGYRSYQGISTVTVNLIGEVDGRSVGEAHTDAAVDSKRTGIVNPAVHVPLERQFDLMGESAWGSEQFQTTLIGQAVGQSLQDLAVQISGLIRPTPEFSISDPQIVDIEGTVAYINVGSAEAVKNGDKFGVYNRGRELKDPQTGTVLGIGLPSRIGVVQIEQVLNPHLSLVRVLDGAEQVKKGFSIRAE